MPRSSACSNRRYPERVRILWTGALAAVALALAGCGSGGGDAAAHAAPAAPKCPQAWRPGWQRVAKRVDAPVYCPSWMPNPVDGQIGGPWTNIVRVDPDGSYLISFIWQESSSGEVHVNLRRYPGTQMPHCRADNSEQQIPCFADPRGKLRVGDIDATLYTVGRDADQWHLTYLWHHDGATYAVGEHVAPPLSYGKVLRNVQHMLRGLVLLRPA